jgi:hypothetical protein
MAVQPITPGKVTYAKEASGNLIWFLAVDFNSKPHLIRWAEILEVTQFTYGGDNTYREGEYTRVVFRDQRPLDLVLPFDSFLEMMMAPATGGY